MVLNIENLQSRIEELEEEVEAERQARAKVLISKIIHNFGYKSNLLVNFSSNIK